MARVSGRLVSAGIGVETARGTSVAPTFWIPDTDFTFQDKNTTVIDESAFGRLETMNDADLVYQWGQGTIGGVVRDSSLGPILKNLFGGYTAANHTGETTVKDHTFTVANNCSHPSLTLVSNDANENVRFALAMVDKLELDYDLGKYLMYKADFQSKKSATGTDTVAYTQENKFRPQDVTVKLASTVAGLTGATPVKIKKIKLVFDPGLTREHVLGQLDVDDINNLVLKTSVTMDLIYNDLTYKNLDFGNARQAMSITITRSDVTIGTAANPTITFTFQPGFFDKWQKNVKNDALVDQTIEFDGLYSLSSSSEVAATLTNTITTY